MRCASRIRKDPTKSVMFGDPDNTRGLDNLKSREEVMNLPFTVVQKISLIGFLLIIIMAVTIIVWGWYLTKLATLFFIFMILTMIVNKMALKQMGNMFVVGCKSALFGALLVGFARSISIVMANGGTSTPPSTAWRPPSRPCPRASRALVC